MSEVDVRGRTPNNLISRAVSHEVGGDGRGEICKVDGGESTSHDTNGSSGLEGFSLRVIVTVTLIAHHALLQVYSSTTWYSDKIFWFARIYSVFCQCSTQIIHHKSSTRLVLHKV